MLTAKELPYPVTVCTHEKCVEIHQLTGSVYETYYKQKCHPHCYLTGVQVQYSPFPQITATVTSSKTFEAGLFQQKGLGFSISLNLQYEVR